MLHMRSFDVRRRKHTKDDQEMVAFGPGCWLHTLYITCMVLESRPNTYVLLKMFYFTIQVKYFLLFSISIFVILLQKGSIGPKRVGKL